MSGVAMPPSCTQCLYSRKGVLERFAQGTAVALICGLRSRHHVRIVTPIHRLPVVRGFSFN